MQACGAPAEVVTRYRAQLIEEARRREVPIFPENWHAICVFLGMGSQWRVIAGPGGGAYQGLDYGALPLVLAEHRAVPHRRPLEQLMPQLRVLERAARDVLNQD